MDAPTQTAHPIKPGQVWLIRLLVLLGFLALANYVRWWFTGHYLASPWLVLLFVAALIYAGMQLAGNWWLYLFAHRQPAALPIQPGLSVDVFVTVAGEPLQMVRLTVAAACAMRGEHRTWVLDDASDPAMAELAASLGAGYLTRSSRTNAKAGNLNAALAQTHGDIIAIFDVDHVPTPEFLERTLGHFSDPRMGFVQTMVTFSNRQDSWVAEAAIETSLEYYNPASLGANGIGGTSMMGSNALIRRSALESIGGYRPGLAEDLATSLALHAAGWKSAYVAEPLAPGLAPPSFEAWFIQQLKWARGVFELLLSEFPRLFFRLKPGQRLAYSVRMTKYWIGPVVGAHLLATVLALTVASAPVRDAFHTYLYAIAPLAVADAVIRHAAFRIFRHRAVPNTSFALALALIYATWPIYILAWGMALLRLPLGFRPTPKTKTGRLNPVWFFPQIAALLFLVAGFAYTVFIKGHPPSILLAFASVQGLLQLIFLQKWLASSETFRLGKLAAVEFSPMAVLDVDILEMEDEVRGLEAYQQAFILARIQRLPVARAILEVRGGMIAKEDLLSTIINQGDWLFWQHWSAHLLGVDLQGGSTAPDLRATIAVCTRNRPQDLERCLAALTRLADLGQELLVVDSCSDGDITQAVAERYPQVRCVREEVPGLDRARNRALREASGEIVAFIDDDAVPDSGWLAALLGNFDSPRVLCVTGLTMPQELETLAQQWFERYSPFGRGFRRRVLDKSNLNPLAAGRAGAGVNMALRKEALQLVGPFHEALDGGTRTRSGGDTEYFSRILAGGYQIVYEPAALSWHRHRRNWKELRQTLYGYGVGTYAYWTQKLLEEGEWGVMALAWQWAWRTQIPGLVRAVLRLSGGLPADLLAAELLGCLSGPGAYLSARRLLKARAGAEPR